MFCTTKSAVCPYKTVIAFHSLCLVKKVLYVDGYVSLHKQLFTFLNLHSPDACNYYVIDKAWSCCDRSPKNYIKYAT